MDWFLETMNLFGLLLLLGGSGFTYLFQRRAAERCTDKLIVDMRRRSLRIMTSGLIIVAATSLANVERPIFAFGTLLLAAVFFAAHYLGERFGSNVLRAMSMLAALAVVGMQAASSHAADAPGVLPILSSFLHWLAAVLWGGCLFHLLLQPWPELTEACKREHGLIAVIARRYAFMTLIIIVALTLTGGVLAFVHIHNADAMNTSAYGTAFKAKMLIALLLLVTVSIGVLKISPACQRAASVEACLSCIARFRILIGLESLLLVALIATSGLLAARSPPGVAPFLNPQTWLLTVGDVPMTVELQPVAGRAGQVRLEFSAASDDHRFPDGTLATFSLVTTDGDAGRYDVDAIPIGPASFLGETTLAVPGEWQLELIIDYPDGDAISTKQVVTLPGPPLEQDMRAYLSATTIGYSQTNIISFGVGLLLMIVAAWSVRLCLQGKAPLWLMSISLLNAALGGFLILSVTFVKTYPSSFWPNPEPYTAAAIQKGDAIYREHCADCHGIAGRGDGPWAVENLGSIPDLTTPHMDTHTDGEIYWWIRYGIPSLDMPALGDELSDRENWTVINFIRSLRHGIPPQHENTG